MAGPTPLAERDAEHQDYDTVEENGQWVRKLRWIKDKDVLGKDQPRMLRFAFRKDKTQQDDGLQAVHYTNPRRLHSVYRCDADELGRHKPTMSAITDKGLEPDIIRPRDGDPYVLQDLCDLWSMSPRWQSSPLTGFVA